MKRGGIIVGIILIGAAYLVGFWPQYQKTRQAQGKLAATTAQLAQAQSDLRMYRLQHLLLALIGKTSEKDYGTASAMSTKFFNQVREEEVLRTEPQLKTVLKSILNQRDTVTSDLAKGDPNALTVLNSLETELFNVVGQLGSGTGAPGPAR